MEIFATRIRISRLISLFISKNLKKKRATCHSGAMVDARRFWFWLRKKATAFEGTAGKAI